MVKTRKRMSGEDRRAQIVRVATELFAKKGFKGTTTREIAQKAAISEAVIFKHFSRKEDLYRAIIDARCNDGLGRSRLIGILKEKEGREVLDEIARYLLDEHQKDSSLLRLLTFSALENHDFSRIFINTRGMELIEFLEGHIKAMIRAGELKKTDPALASRAFIGMVIHYSVMQEIYGLKSHFKRANGKVAVTFAAIFYEGLKK